MTLQRTKVPDGSATAKALDHSLKRSAAHNPYACLRDAMARLPMHRASWVGELLPHRWQSRWDGRALTERGCNGRAGVGFSWQPPPGLYFATNNRTLARIFVGPIRLVVANKWVGPATQFDKIVDLGR